MITDDQLSHSKQLYEDLQQYLVNGVSSSFHKAAVEQFPISFDHGKGSHLYDIDGHEYIDYVLGFGPLILGHAPSSLANVIYQQAQKGSLFSAPFRELLELSKQLTKIIPCAEQVSYQNTGTESVMHVFRLARAYTGKEKIVKFEGHYHGWSDEQKISIDAATLDELGNRLRPNKIHGSLGQPDNAGDNVIVLPWNDLGALEECFKRHANEIAGIIMEPFMCDSGPIFPKKGYLEGVRKLTTKYHIVLIFDEVITGFRLSLGGAQEYFGVTPDLATFAKSVAGGYPLSLICGKKEIMNCGVASSGTFNANPIVVAAALQTLKELQQPGTYEKFNRLATMLTDGVKALANKHHLAVYSKPVGSICTLEFGFTEKDPIVDLRDLLRRSDLDMYNKFYLLCRQHGIRVAGKRGRIYLSTAHTEEDIATTLKAFDDIFGELA